MKTHNIVLIAEDDPVLLKAYEQKFSRTKYKVHLASNGTEAVEIIKKNPPDVFICDIMMPQYDGWWVLDELKNLEHNFPVIVLTNKEDEHTTERLKEYNVDHYLIKKDMSLVTLVELVEKLIAEKQ